MEQFCTRIFVPVIVTRSWLTNGKRLSPLAEGATAVNVRTSVPKSLNLAAFELERGAEGARRMSIGSIADRQVFWNFWMVNRLLTACCALLPEQCSFC